MESDELRKRPDDRNTLVERLASQIRSPAWARNTEAQTVTLRTLRADWEFLTAEQRDHLVAVVSETLKASPERVGKLLELGELQEIRRALRFTADRNHHRLANEHVYPREGWIGTYLLYAQGMEVPLAWHFWCALAVLGACMKRHFYLDMNNYYLWPNLYTMLIGPSGEGKSAAIAVAVDIVRRVNKLYEKRGVVEWRRVTVTPQRCTPEKLINMIRTQKVIDQDSNDLLVEHETDSTCFVVADEIVTLLGKSTFHSDQWIHILTALYTSPQRFDASTISRGNDELKNPTISCLFGSTADWIRTSVTDDMFSGGFMGRCVFVPRETADRDYPLADVLDPITANFLAEMLVEFTNCEPFEFLGSSGWWDLHHDLHIDSKRQAESSDQTMRGYYNRKVAHVLKVAMLMAIAEGRRTGEPEDITKAVRIVEMEEFRLPECFSEMNAHKTSLLGDYVLKMIVKHGGRLGHSDLFRRVGKRVGPARDLEAVIHTLASQRRVRVLRPQEGVRKGIEYEVLAVEQFGGGGPPGSPAMEG